MAKILSVRLDDTLYAALKKHAQRRGLKPSSAVRDLIRRGLGAVSSEREAGFAEGVFEAKAAVLDALKDALKGS
jgi:antitoxin component of RelBE/YafQ-DinJ toxin-antitoxin module